MQTEQQISGQLGLSLKAVQATLKLLAEGATVPFIARYRKEATLGLDEVQIADIQELNKKIDELNSRRIAIIESITEQGKITDELLTKIQNCSDMASLEDLYLPYKQKRKTRATIAIEKGLEPLALLIFEQKTNGIDQAAIVYISPQVPNTAEAIAGAKDIIAEWINEDQRARAAIRKVFEKTAIIYSKVKKGKEADAQKFLDYFAFDEDLAKVPSHRMLAMRRGEAEGLLSLKIQPDEDKALQALEYLFLKGLPEPKKIVETAMVDAYSRMLQPSLENEFFKKSKEKADIEAIRIFDENLRQLLLSAPLGQKTVLALDPGFRTGCKMVVLDKNSSLIYNSVIYPHNGPNEMQKAAEHVLAQVKNYHVQAVAIGNGTAGRETEQFVKQILPKEVAVYMVSEQGASIYSASAVAREEFPQQDVTVRGAVSIGRRLMDPLAELVKIDPKSIGVGQYQHDVDQKQLKENLDQTVVSCVNRVGVNLNTASKHLLSYVSGLGPSLAQNVVDFRAQNGNFLNRSQLKKVPRLGEKAFEQCAGFLRIKNAKNPLDSTAVHPESYHLVENMAKDLNCNVADLVQNASLRQQIQIAKYVSPTKGLHTLNDILQELAKPGLDPRESLTVFEFDPNIRSIDDLKEGHTYPGIVTNITAFGVFVDLGVKQDGLVHVSQLADKFVKDPNQVVKLQQTVQVRVVEVDLARKRVALSMKKFN
jgi:protein Tex